MTHVPGRTWQGSGVAINGPALRMIRQLVGLNCRQLATEIGKTPAYLRRIETGIFRTVSPELFLALCHELRIDDRRVLLTYAWNEDQLEQLDEAAESAEFDEAGASDDEPEQSTATDEAAHAG